MPTLAEVNTELRTQLYNRGIVHNDSEYQLFILSNYDTLYDIFTENNPDTRRADLAILYMSLTFADTDNEEHTCPQKPV